MDATSPTPGPMGNHSPSSSRTSARWVEGQRWVRLVQIEDGAIVGTTAEGSPNSFLCKGRHDDFVNR